MGPRSPLNVSGIERASTVNSPVRSKCRTFGARCAQRLLPSHPTSLPRVVKLLTIQECGRGKGTIALAQKVTLKQIANEVGLSPSSVSLVLNGRPCRISEENRRRIKEVAAREHYVPNQIARSLVMRESKTLGLIVPNIESRFFSSLAKNLEQRCRAEGYALFITNSDGLPENDLDLLALLVTRGVDGIFLVVADELADDSALVNELSHLPVPYVMIDRVVDNLACDKVLFDHERGGYMATKYLLEKGHERIACMVNAAKSMTGRKRLAGYGRALAEANVAFDPSLVIETDYYISDAFEASAKVLDTDATAVFASSDNIALGLLKRLYKCGRRVPSDYSVVSYDNSAADALFEPALTSIEQDVTMLSEHAINMMLRKIEKPTARPIERVLEPRLVVQGSVSPR